MGGALCHAVGYGHDSAGAGRPGAEPNFHRRYIFPETYRLGAKIHRGYGACHGSLRRDDNYAVDSFDLLAKETDPCRFVKFLLARFAPARGFFPAAFRGGCGFAYPVQRDECRGALEPSRNIHLGFAGSRLLPWSAFSVQRAADDYRRVRQFYQCGRVPLYASPSDRSHHANAAGRGQGLRRFDERHHDD